MKKKDRFDEIDSALKELQESILKLEGIDTDEIARKVEQFREDIYSGISRWSSVELARHVERPVLDDYIDAVFSDFLEIHGDRSYEDDAAVKGVGVPGRHTGHGCRAYETFTKSQGLCEASLRHGQPFGTLQGDAAAEDGGEVQETGDHFC